jgi:DNA mismatch repair protein MSH6
MHAFTHTCAGRGTSTFDGNAIAYAVTKHLTTAIGCRTLFATHYHTLCDDFASDPHVALGHMVRLSLEARGARVCAVVWLVEAAALPCASNIPHSLIACSPRSPTSH